MTMYALVILLATASGLALVCVAPHPRTVRALWPAAACLTGALLGVPVVGILGVMLAAFILVWPARWAWA